MIDTRPPWFPPQGGDIALIERCMPGGDPYPIVVCWHHDDQAWWNATGVPGPMKAQPKIDEFRELVIRRHQIVLSAIREVIAADIESQLTWNAHPANKVAPVTNEMVRRSAEIARTGRWSLPKSTPTRPTHCELAGCGHALSMHNELGYCRSQTTPDRQGACTCDSTLPAYEPTREKR